MSRGSMSQGVPKPISGFQRNDVDCSLDIDLDAKLAERLTMPNDGVPGPENCNCEPGKLAVIRTVWTGCDKGRRVLTCPIRNGTRCNFKVWLDGPFSLQARKVIEHMYKTIEQLEFENAVGLGMKNLQWVDYAEEEVVKDDDVDVSSSY